MYRSACKLSIITLHSLLSPTLVADVCKQRSCISLCLWRVFGLTVDSFAAIVAQVHRFVVSAGARPHAPQIMARARLKRKESLALEEAATATSVGVGNIASIARQNDISDITERLSSDPQLAFTLGSLLRDGTLVTMLKGGDYGQKCQGRRESCENERMAIAHLPLHH